MEKNEIIKNEDYYGGKKKKSRNNKKMIIIISAAVIIIAAVVIIIFVSRSSSPLKNIIDTDVSFNSSDTVSGNNYKFNSYTFDNDISFDLAVSNKFSVVNKDNIAKVKSDLKSYILPIKKDSDNYSSLITIFDPDITVKVNDYYLFETDDTGKINSIKYYSIDNESLFVLDFD